MCLSRTPLPKRSLTCLVLDQTPARRLQQVVQQRARTLLCPRHLPPRQPLRPVVRLLVVCRQVEVPVAVLQLEKETRLPSLSVCCDSHCNRTSR